MFNTTKNENKIMGILKDLIFINVYIFSLLVLYLTEYNNYALILVIAVSALCIVKYVKLKKSVKEVYSKNLKLKDMMEQQKEFFTETLIHDLKVPTLAQLRGLELLKDGTMGPVSLAQKDMIIHIEQSCKYILEMISAMLSTYRLDSSKNTLSYEQINLAELLLECFTEISPLAQEKGVSFAYFATQEDTKTEADKAEIRKVIINLLSTAIMYSNRDEQIIVNIKTDNGNLKFSIITRGVALTERECATMFECFNKDIPKYTTVGNDISLYLAKKIIELHNGTIYASTDGIITNTFTFIIPQCSQSLSLDEQEEALLI